MFSTLLDRLLYRTNRPAQRRALPGGLRPAARRLAKYRLHLECLEDRTLMSGTGLAGAYGQVPLSFEANQGQTDASVHYLARGSGYGLFLTSDQAVLSLHNAAGAANVLDVRLVGGNATPLVTGLDPQPGIANYYTGNDPSQWLTNVATFGQVGYQNVYPGVDLVFYGNQQQLEYDFTVAPGADPGQIVLDIQGADQISLDGQGNLVLHTSGGDLVEHAPVLYQNVDGTQAPVSGSFVLLGDHQVGFQVGAYDATRPLVIDPTLSYSTYLGGSLQDVGNAIAIDAGGDAYVTGSTTSLNFPTSPGAFQPNYADTTNTDAFVTKFNAQGNGVIYSTYLGGSNADDGNGIAVDSSGGAYVVGDTSSSAFPTTPGALQIALGGRTNAFAVKFNAAGALVYGTFLGGLNVDKAVAVALDGSNQAYVSGLTDSANFPVTPGAFQTTFVGTGSNNDAFVAVVNSAGSRLIYSTFLGGAGEDQATAITVDPKQNAYVTGFTFSTNFPTTAGAFQTTLAGAKDAFVTKIDPTGATLVYSTYLGGATNDQANGIALDPSLNAYVVGTTDSGNFPVTAGVIQPVIGGGADIFVTKLNPTGTALAYSTFFGGLGNDMGNAIAVDPFGNAYFTGQTNSSNFPTVNPLSGHLSLAGGTDAYVAEFNSIGTKVLFSTYLGGPLNDSASSIATDGTGNVYLTGTTAGLFPTTSGSFQPLFGGGLNDAWVAKVTGLPVPQFHLVFGQQPTDTLFNAIIKPPVTVLIEDLNNQVVTTDSTDPVVLALGANPGGGTLSGTLMVTAVNGVATFSDLSINKIGTGYTLTAASPTGYPGAVSNPFNIVKPTHIAFLQQPTNAKEGAIITPAITVQILDANNQVVTVDSQDQVTLSIGTNPGGGSLAGTVTVTALNGVATFSDLSIDKAGIGYTLVASSPGLVGATSATFNIQSTKPQVTHLGFGQQPTNTAKGAPISPPVTVLLLDSTDQVVTSDNTDTVTVSLGNNPGSATLNGTLTVTAVNGVATFSDLSINNTGMSYTLMATTTDPSVTGATSQPFNVFIQQPVDHMAFIQQPTTTQGGSAISPPVTVALEDRFNNIVTTDNIDRVTLTIGNNPGGGTLFGTTTVTALRGIATFSNLTINKAGVGYTLVATANRLAPIVSKPFDILPGPVVRLQLTVTPPVTDAGRTVTLTVAGIDRFGGVNPTYRGTIHFTSSDPLALLPADYTFTAADNGVHSFQVTLSTIGLQVITAVDRATPSISGSVQVQVNNPNPFGVYVTGADAGGGPQVKMFDAATKTQLFSFFAYDPAFTGGVRVAVGTVFNNGAPDIITGPGPGGGPDIHVYDGRTGQLRYSFFAFDPAFTGGVWVGAGDVNGDGYSDIIVGADAGGGPSVLVVSGRDLSVLQSYFAYDPNFTGGVRVAGADVDGDGFTDIITGAGPGGGPNVTVHSGRTNQIMSSFFAYDPGFTAGIFVSGINPSANPLDRKMNIVTGPDVGGGPDVRVFDGVTAALLENFLAEQPGNFTLGPDNGIGLNGVRVGWVSLNGAPAIVTSFGPREQPKVLAFDYGTLEQVDSFFAYDPLFTGGVFIAPASR